jgi:hypothetical protein
MEITAKNLFETLTLDSIYGVLSWCERANIHLFLNHKVSFEVFSEKIENMVLIVSENNFEAPSIKFADDRLLYFLHEGQFLPIEKYAELHPKITEQILKQKT